MNNREDYYNEMGMVLGKFSQVCMEARDGTGELTPELSRYLLLGIQSELGKELTVIRRRSQRAFFD